MTGNSTAAATPAKVGLSRSDTNAKMLVAVEQSRRIVFEFIKLNAYVPVLVQADGSSNDTLSRVLSRSRGDELPPTERQILHEVSGVVEPGEVMALMGPSGSGKTSLLALLGGRSKSRVTGQILFNGQPMNKTVKRAIGFVTQDDLLFAELTVFETLYYAAMLRLPREWSKEDKMERVEMVLQGLGLAKCRDTIIGNHMMRGVSGGERKRASIGHELLINPSVIFMDEPTSGLDSTTALNLIQTLRSLASGGRTIIASIHQPSGRLYEEIDKLLLLSEGHVMFYGDAHASADWFEKHGAPVPMRVTIPDHLLDLACGEVPGYTPDEGKALQQRLIAAWDQRSIGLGRHGVQPTDFSPTATSPATTRLKASSSTNSINAKADDPSAPLSKVSKADVSKDMVALEVEEQLRPAADSNYKWGASWIDQVRILTSRCVRVRRLSYLPWQRYAEIVIPGVLCGLFWWQIGRSDVLDRQQIIDMTGLIFFVNVFLSWNTVFGALMIFPSEMNMIVKERQSGMYRLSAYYVARSLCDIPMDCLVPTLFIWVVYWMAGLRLAAGAFFCFWFAMLLTVLVAQAFGLLFGVLVGNPRTLITMSTIFTLCLILVGGFLVQTVPIWIAWLKYVSFMAWSYNVLLKVEFGHRTYSCTDFYKDNPAAVAGKTECSIAEGDVIKNIDVDAPVNVEIGVLIGMLLLVRVLVYLALQRRTRFAAA